MAGALLVSGHIRAQRTKPQTRITAQIDNLRRSTVVGSRAPQATLANDLGAVDPTLQLQGITLVFSPSPAQKTAIDALAAAQQNPASPQYHRWLKPEQFAAKFGMADTDIATVSSWLERQGFVVGSVSRSRNRLTFSGSAGMVAAAFGGPLHNYKGKGETSSHMAPSADLSIPAALGSVIQSIGNLSSFRPHSNAVLPTKGRPQPQYTAGGYQVAYLVPPDVATIYNVNPAYGAGYDGSGQTIAVIGQSEVVPQDLANFQTALGVTGRPQSLNLISGTGDSAIVAGDDIESDLDLEYASAMAPGAAVSLYYVGNSGYYNAFDAIVYVVDHDLAEIISVSYAVCEPNIGSAGMAAFDLTLEQAAVQGQTVVVAAGDNGSISCNENMWNPVAVKEAPTVDFPASSPWVVGLGGTQIPVADLGDPVNTTYWATSPDSDVLSSALSYIPEQTWNDFGLGQSGGGGGTSIYEPQPLWQAGVPGIPATGFRLVPDISLISSDMQPGYLICTSDTIFQTATGCTQGFFDAQGIHPQILGGTSVAAPIFAGLVAVLNQAKGYTASGQGLINPTLYSLASVPATYASAFHDITDGNNACWNVPFCGTGPQNTDYASGVGYDEASGLGSIDFAALLAAWPMNSETPSIATATILGVSSQNMQYGMPLTLTAMVSGGTGAVSFFSNGKLLGPATLTSGMATFIPAPDLLQPGANIITATYDGDTGFEPSTSAGTIVTVTKGSTTTVFTASSTTPAFGSSVTFTVAVTTNGIPMVSTGFVQYWNDGQALGASIVGDPPYGTTTFSVSTLPFGANPITVSFQGNADYTTSTSAVTIVNVGPPTTTTTLAASPSSPTFGNPVSLTATVLATGVAVPSGAVTFFNGGLSIGVGIVSNGVATISLSSLPAGNNSITVNYGGTSTYAVSTSAALVVTVMPAPTTTTLNSSTSTVTFGGPVTLAATVSVGSSAASGGAVSFLNGGSIIGTSTVSDGIATLHLSSLAVGADSITASYGGTASYGASASSEVIVNVTPALTSTTLSSSTTTPLFGSSVTLTATVGVTGVPATSGVVTFLSNGFSVGTGVVNGFGVATLSLSTLPTGSDTIAATFGGTSNLAASASIAVMVTVSPDITTTILSTSAVDIPFGTNVTLRGCRKIKFTI
jgi:subtilase family serine protease